jgi:hypothetical protein
MTATVQWQAHAGVTHAWLAQCEGYVSLCGREVSGFVGQRSGIRCGLCATSAGWAAQTGESSYWTPHGPMIVENRHPQAPKEPRMTHVHEPPRAVRPRTRRGPMVPVTMGSVPQAIAADPTPPPAEPAPLQDVPQVGAVLQAPTSLADYATLPEAEQRYWAPLMLARAGRAAVWDRTLETAADFQQRCYEALQAHEGQV